MRYCWSILDVKVPLQILGAAVAIASTYVMSWGDGYDGGNVGGLLAAMLSPTKGFGKFLTFLLSLSTAGNIAATFYSISINLQVLMPFLVVVPRYAFSIVAMAMSVSSLNHFSALMLYQCSSYLYRGCSQILRGARQLSGYHWLLGCCICRNLVDGAPRLQTERL